MKYFYYFLGFIGIIAIIITIQFKIYSPKCDGLDVSHHNALDLSKYDIQFIIAKATEGNRMKDRKFQKYKEYAKANDLKFGAYHFLTWETSAKEQFENYKSKVGRDIDIIPCLDIEKNKNQEWSYKRARKFAKEWSILCKEYYGVYPIIYCNDYYRAIYFYDMPNKFWICNWKGKPIIDYNCVIHQYTNNNNTIDFNHLRTDIKNILFDPPQDL